MTDRHIAILFARIPHDCMLPFMENYGPQITDDNNYWNFLGTAWKAGGCFKDQSRWIELFKSQRRNSHKIMKTSERREFSRLPKTEQVDANKTLLNIQSIQETITRKKRHFREIRMYISQSPGRRNMITLCRTAIS